MQFFRFSPISICLLALTTCLASQANEHPAPTAAHATSPHTKEEAPADNEKILLGKSQPYKTFIQQTACEKMPEKDTKDLWNRANCFSKTQLYLEAARILQQVSKDDSKDLDAYFVASWLLWKESDRLGGSKGRTYLQEGLDELLKARASNPTDWRVDIEIGDYYYLRIQKPDRAYLEYKLARKNSIGDESRGVEKASRGRLASIENRIARTAERLDRRGEAVEASCLALYYDPDDKTAKDRIEKLHGSCVKKKIENPLKNTSEESHH